jgi:N-acetylmuramic acid 6-phosphate etherase
LKRIDLKTLTTEQSNRATSDLDTKSAIDIARTINSQDKKVARAVEQALPEIAQAIDLIATSLKSGGRLIYVGAGTSGRIAALDAAECPPTYGTDPRLVQFVIAGGAKALGAAVEANEDSTELGQREMAKKKPGKKDVVVGIAASGRTPFTIAAVKYARRKGSKTVAVTCNRNSPLATAAQLAIVAEVGPEAIAGSTRMKAGTAQKMILNMLSSGAMTRLGYVYGNSMVNVHVKNEKLRERGITILQNAADVSRQAAVSALKAAADRVPIALVMLKSNANRRNAERLLRAHHGNVRETIKAAGKKE